MVYTLDRSTLSLSMTYESLSFALTMRLCFCWGMLCKFAGDIPTDPRLVFNFFLLFPITQIYLEIRHRHLYQC